LTAYDDGDDASQLGTSRHLLLMINSTPDPREFSVPAVVSHRPWQLFIDTGAASPHDVYPELDGPLMSPPHRVTLTYRSLQCYLAP
jgi:glycogen operon protein